MILTCPNCATRYFLHDVLVGRAGRTVKCTACASTWRAEAVDEEPLTLQAPSPDLGGPVEAEPAALRALPADRLSQTFRARAQEQRKVREAAATGAIWAGLAAGFVLLIALGAVFRMDVVRLWPKTASAYAAAGLPVNTTGLIIEQVKASPGVDNGHPAVMVSGVMRNVVDRTVNAPPLRVSLLGKDGRPVAHKLADAPDTAPIRAGETRHFSISMPDPPKSASDVEVTFVLDMAAPSKAQPPTPKLRGPLATPPPAAIPVAPRAASPAALKTVSAKPSAVPSLANAPDAKALPAGSPYALQPKASVG
jgi:predicted Zn finger-like uncharacterized protein